MRTHDNTWLTPPNRSILPNGSYSPFFSALTTIGYMAFAAVVRAVNMVMMMVMAVEHLYHLL